jgi:hypothetical protein
MITEIPIWKITEVLNRWEDIQYVRTHAYSSNSKIKKMLEEMQEDLIKHTIIAEIQEKLSEIAKLGFEPTRIILGDKHYLELCRQLPPEAAATTNNDMYHIQVLTIFGIPIIHWSKESVRKRIYGFYIEVELK